MLFKLSKNIFITIFSILILLINKPILSSDSDNKITPQMLSLLLMPNDSLKEKIIKQYESLLKQILPNGLISIELGSNIKLSPADFDEYYSPRSFSEDGKTYIRSNAYGISKIDVKTNTVLKEFNLKEFLNDEGLDTFAQAKNKYAIAGANIIILICEDKDIKILNDHQTKSNRITLLSFSSDGKRLAYGNSADNNIIVWDISNEDLKYQNLKNTHFRSITCSFGNDDKYFFSSCYTKICIWNAKTLSIISEINNGDYLSNGGFDCVKISNDNKYIIAGISKPHDQGGSAEIWDIENPLTPVKKAQTPNLGSGFINVAISDDSKYFITSNWSQIILWKIFDLISGSKKEISMLNKLNSLDPIYNLEFNRNDKYFIYGSYNHKILDFSKSWIVYNLILKQIALIINLALSNDVNSEIKAHSHYKEIIDSFDPKIGQYIMYYLILKENLKNLETISIINSYASYDFT